MSHSVNKYIVSNVDATREWLATMDVFRDFEALPYLGHRVKTLQRGDIVVGSLPLHLAAQICDQGAEYWHINFRRPRHPNRNFTVEEMDERATIERFRIERLEQIV